MNAKLKVKAKKSLSKNLKPFLLATIILMVLEGICYVVADGTKAPWIASLLVLIVEALFLPGFIKMAMDTTKNKKVKLEDLFSETESFFKYIGVSILVFAVVFILGLLGAIAFRSLVAIMFFNAEISLALSIFLIVLGIILITAILLVLIYLVICFSQVLFILVDEPKLSVREILSKSFDMMENYVVEYFVLILSFIGWILLGAITFGILYIWVTPYMIITLAYFYEKVKKDFENYNGEEKEVSAVEPIKVASKTTTKKAPAKKTTSKVAAKPATKATTKKATTTKAKAAAKKPATKTTTKTTTKKATAAKTPAKKATTKTAASKTTTRKTATKAATAKKTTATKTTTAKKATAAKKTATKTTTKKSAK